MKRLTSLMIAAVIAVASGVALHSVNAAAAPALESQPFSQAEMSVAVNDAVRAFFLSVTPGSPPPASADGVGAFDTSTGVWHLRTRGGDPTVFTFGAVGDVPLAGDWNNDGIDTIGTYDPASRAISLRNTNSAGTPDTTFTAGLTGDIPFVGDFDGDGIDTVAFFRPSNATIYVYNSLGSGGADLGTADASFVFGAAGQTPFAGDFNADGTDTVAFYDPSTGAIVFHGGTPAGFVYSAPSGLFMSGDWDGDGDDTPGVFTTSGQPTVYLRNANTAGGTDESYTWGTGTWEPVSGVFGALESGLAVSVADAPQGLAWAVESLYLEFADAPHLPGGLRTHLAGAANSTGVTGTAYTATAYGAQVGVVVVGSDTIFAVSDDTWEWRVVAAHIASEGKTQWLGDGPQFFTVIGTDQLNGLAPSGRDPIINYADSIHIISLVPETGEGAIVGIPRDTIMDYTGPGSYNGQQKIAWANKDYGPSVTNQVIEDNTGVPLAGYFATGFGSSLVPGFTGFTDLVADMGGIDPFYVPYSIADQCPPDPPPPIATAGDQSLSPNAALAFSRERKCTLITGLVNGNQARTLSQGLLMKQAIGIVQDLGIAAMPGLLDIADDHVQTDFTADDVLRLAAMIYDVDTGLLPTLTENDLSALGVEAYDLNPGSLPNVNVDGCVAGWQHEDGIPLEDWAYGQFMQPVNQSVFNDLADNGVLDVYPIPDFDSGSWTYPTSCPWLPINHFPDVLPGTWYFSHVESLWGNGIVEGRPDGNYAPYDIVPRREMGPFMVRTVGETENPKAPPDPFPDVSWDAWYAGWTTKLVELGIAEGTDEGLFLPDKNMTRGEAAAVIVRTLGYPNPPVPTTPPFTDVPVNKWYAKWVAKLKDLGITNGRPDGTYGPDDSMNRAEFATLISRAFL